jgi:hypothetical protein
LTGHAADLYGLKTALIVPALCYCGILAFGNKLPRALQELTASRKPTIKSAIRAAHGQVP